MPEAHYVGDSCEGGHRDEYEEMFIPFGGQSPLPVVKPTYHLESVQFIDGGLAVVYMTDQDRRVGGSLLATHTLAIREDDQYARRIEKVRTAVIRLLEDAREDFESSPADVPSTDDDESDDED